MAPQNLVADKMKAVHETVLADLHNIEKAAGSALPFTRHLHEALVDAHGHLARQFRFEEKDGYMSSPASGTPINNTRWRPCAETTRASRGR